MPRIFEFKLELGDTTLEHATRAQVIAQRDRFREAVRTSGIDMNGADTRFEQVFQIVIQGKAGNSLYDADAEGEAYVALEKGFSYTPAAVKRYTRDKGNGRSL